MAPKLIMAPMATLSHEAFRRCVARFGGCDEYFNEMINAGSLLHQGPFEKYYMMSGPEPEKMVWQITGTRADYMAQAASVLAQLPGLGLDINMGCSAPQIANTGAGVAWMTKPISETQAMVKAVKAAAVNSAKDGKPEPRLSVKLRLGDEDYTDEGFFKFTDMLVGEGVQMLTLHARTRKEKLARHLPRYEYVEQLALRYPDIPVILNGDVKNFESYKYALSKAPHSAGVMIARAAAEKPWIFAKIKADAARQQNPASENSAPENTIDLQQVALDFIDDVEKYQPADFWPTRLQRFFAYFCMNFSFGNYFKTQMLNSKDNDDARARVLAYFEKLPDDRYLHI